MCETHGHRYAGFDNYKGEYRIRGEEAGWHNGRRKLEGRVQSPPNIQYMGQRSQERGNLNSLSQSRYTGRYNDNFKKESSFLGPECYWCGRHWHFARY